MNLKELINLPLRKPIQQQPMQVNQQPMQNPQQMQEYIKKLEARIQELESQLSTQNQSNLQGAQQRINRFG